MHSNSSFYQLKINCCKYKLLYLTFMVTTKEKAIVNLQKIIRKESKYTTKESHQTTKEESKRRKKEQRNYKTARKQLTKWK